jgi:hypothetical protein
MKTLTRQFHYVSDHVGDDLASDTYGLIRQSHPANVILDAVAPIDWVEAISNF